MTHNISAIGGVISDAISGWAGWALAHPEFGSSLNPITTMGADYAHHITTSPTGFEIPAEYLISVLRSHAEYSKGVPFW